MKRTLKRESSNMRRLGTLTNLRRGSRCCSFQRFNLTQPRISSLLINQRSNYSLSTEDLTPPIRFNSVHTGYNTTEAVVPRPRKRRIIKRSRIAKKSSPSIEEIDYLTPDGEVVAKSTAGSYQLRKLREHLIEDMRLPGVRVRTSIGDKEALIISKTIEGKEKAWFFFLKFGAYVRWGEWPTEELETITKKLKFFEERPEATLSKADEDYYFEHFNYYFEGKTSGVRQRLNKPIDGDVEDILQVSENTDSENTINQMLAISYALGQGAKLNIAELALESMKKLMNEIESKKELQKDLVYSMIRRVQRQKFAFFGGGVDFISRSTSLFWDRPQLEKLWLSVGSNLAIFNRSQVARTQLDVFDSVSQRYGEMLNTTFSHSAEKMIVILIVIEVVFGCWEHGAEIFHFVKKMINKALGRDLELEWE
eukprot:TRINITY_DN7843_c0_g1_i1.p1 TRINITY_DN7843_c0_g1~~TRINITY_DN7843_c0_g1_i1.p1  ORF type:complete len:423 (-),score=95.29 TRINITY_DN7843_c0_g1_i1:33-1301(-)